MTLETGPAVGKLVEAVQNDLQGIAGSLEDALGRMKGLEAVGALVPGLASLLKAKSAELGLSVEALRSAAADVPKKLLVAVERPMPDGPGPTREGA